MTEVITETGTRFPHAKKRKNLNVAGNCLPRSVSHPPPLTSTGHCLQPYPGLPRNPALQGKGLAARRKVTSALALDALI